MFLLIFSAPHIIIRIEKDSAPIRYNINNKKGVYIMNEIKTTNAERVKKSHAQNYSQLRVNVRKEKLEIWKQYAASKNTSLYALVNQFFEDAMEKDGFVPEAPKTEE